MIGIPYASIVEIDHYTITRRCPVCGEDFEESTDREGEVTTNNYGEHYEREHNA